MYLFIFIIIVFAVIAFIAFIKPSEQQKSNFGKQPMHFDILDDNGDTIKNIPEKLMDLTTTTVAQRQRVYKRSFQKQLQFDELQRRAEASGDTATLEAIRLGTYNGPLPKLKEDVPTLTMSHSTGNPDAPVQELEYFCIKDKGYHVSVWPKDQSQFDIVEFNIAGMSHRDNIDDYLGEFKGTLEAEPTNDYDPNAIKVLTNDGHHVGYVPKDMTSEIRNNATLPCACFCYIGENDGTYFSDCYIHRTN
jgi:hypothetical protein